VAAVTRFGPPCGLQLTPGRSPRHRRLSMPPQLQQIVHRAHQSPNPVKPLDSLHLAAAVEHRCTLFLTGDVQLKRFPEIPVEILS
jgi:predicted nucleic acid-binding protein